MFNLQKWAIGSKALFPWGKPPWGFLVGFWDFARNMWPGMPEWLFGQQTQKLWVGMCLTWHTPPNIWCMCAKPWGLMRKSRWGYGLAPGFCPRHQQLSSLSCFSFPAFVKMLWRLLRAKPILLPGLGQLLSGHLTLVRSSETCESMHRGVDACESHNWAQCWFSFVLL